MTDTDARPSGLIGLDLGGSFIKAAALGGDGVPRLLDLRPSRAAQGAEAALEALVEAATRVAREAPLEPRGVGLGVPGAVDHERGVGHTPHLPGLESLDLRAALESRLGVRVRLDNDANCAALGEARLGAARGAACALVVLVGTGVGAGLIVNGRLHVGPQGGAGEIGHWPIGSGELACRCGVPGCAEPEMSAEGLRRSCEARGLPWRDPAAVFEAAAAGRPEAVELTARLADRLGATIAIAAQLVDCDRVVLGGGVAATHGFPFGAVCDAASGFLQHWRRAVGLAIVPATLGLHAGAIGAALLAADDGA